MNISLICPTRFLTLPAARQFPGNRIFRKKYQTIASGISTISAMITTNAKSL